ASSTATWSKCLPGTTTKWGIPKRSCGTCLRPPLYKGMEGKQIVLIGADHAGFALKAELIPAIQALGYDIQDRGAFTFEPEDDYPDYVLPMAQEIAKTPGASAVFIGGR